jgi:hypothetical protein
MRERKRRNFNQGYKGSLFLGRATGAIVIIGIMGFLVLYTVLQVNEESVRGDKLSELMARKNQLSAEKDRLMVEATRLQSIQEIQKDYQDSEIKKMVPVQKINYLPTTNVAVK